MVSGHLIVTMQSKGRHMPKYPSLPIAGDVTETQDYTTMQFRVL